MIYSVLLAFGDSLTFGARDENSKCWPQYLAEKFTEEKRQPLLFANEGINGEVIASACKRAYPTVMKYPAAAEVVFFEGTNDSKPQYRTPVNEYLNSLFYIYNVVRALGRTLFLPTLPGLTGFGSQEYDTQSAVLIEQYNGVIRSCAKHSEAVLVELSEMSGEKKFFVDGVHLTALGGRFVADKIFDKIMERREFK